jgi:hypothetical protein
MAAVLPKMNCDRCTGESFDCLCLIVLFSGFDITPDGQQGQVDEFPDSFLGNGFCKHGLFLGF